MTNNDHNPTSPPWLQSHSTDTAEVASESANAGATPEPAPGSARAENAADRPESAPARESDTARPEPEPRYGPIEQNVYAPPPAPERNYNAPPGFAPAAEQQSFAPPEQQSFAPPAEQQSFAPPAEQQSFAPPGQFPPPGPYGHPGQFAPPPNRFAAPAEQQSFAPPPAEPPRRAPGAEQDPFAPPAEQQSFAPPADAFAPPGQLPPPNGPFAPPNLPYGADPHGGSGRAPLPEPPGAPRPGAPYGPEGGPQEQQGGPGFNWPPGTPQPGTPPPGPPTGPQSVPGPPPGFAPPGGPGGPGQGPAGQTPFQPQHFPQPGQSGQSVNDLNLLKRARKAPRSGWRRAVHKVSAGMINPGESTADINYRDLVGRVNQPVRGDYRIAILSLKGGVGKTTTTVGLGSTFASVRGDRVIAIDANPDLGTLAHRVPRQTRSTVRNLLEDQHISRYSDVRAHTSQAPSRLEVLASEQDPAVSEAFSEADYRKAIGILQSFYNIILTDCGTGLMHSAMAGVLDMASALVLVTSPAIDGARSASATLDWLEHHGYTKLVERTVVVVNASRRGASTVDLDQLRGLFLDRTRAVQVVPFDDHLAEGAEIDLELVGKPTRKALLELAAMVADDFSYLGGGRFEPQQQYGHPGMY